MKKFTQLEVFLVIDIGSSSMKAALISPQGTRIATVQEKHEFAEIKNAEEVFDRVIQLGHTLLSRQETKLLIRAVSASALLSYVLLDSAGRSSFDILGWSSNFIDGTKHWFDALDSTEFSKVSGRRITSDLSGVKLSSIREQFPDEYSRTRHFLSLTDYINFRFTGEIVTDPVHAAFTGFTDISRNMWNTHLLESLNFSTQLLPAICEGSHVVGHIDTDILAHWGIDGPVDVVNGGPDGSVAVLGAGGVNSGDRVDVMGTTDVYYAVSDQPVQDPKTRVITNPHLLTDRWLIGGPTGPTGGAISWFMRILQETAPHEISHRQLEQEFFINAYSSLDQPFFLADFLGSRSPHWQGQSKGTLFGLSMDHKSLDIYRSLIECSGYLLREIEDILSQLLTPGEGVTAVGGASTSNNVLQMRSNIFNMEIQTTREAEATLLGSAVLAAIATGYYPSPQAACTEMVSLNQTYRPDGAAVAHHDIRYGRYQSLRSMMLELYPAS